MKTILNKLKPGVNKAYLLFVSGILWVCVGIMLNAFSYKWLTSFHSKSRFVFLAIGITGAFIIHHFGFLRVVDKNLGRISTMSGKPCIFSFMTWKSYILVAVMVSLGIILRHSSIPKQYLSVIYTAIGFALILSSVRYFRVLISQLFLNG